MALCLRQGPRWQRAAWWWRQRSLVPHCQAAQLQWVQSPSQQGRHQLPTPLSLQSAVQSNALLPRARLLGQLHWSLWLTAPRPLPMPAAVPPLRLQWQHVRDMWCRT